MIVLALAALLGGCIYYRFHYEPPIQFYGQVVDENGQPVANARVKYSIRRRHGGKFTLPIPVLFYSGPDGSSVVDGTCTTGSDGRFVIRDRGDYLAVMKIEAAGHEVVDRAGLFRFGYYGRDTLPFYTSNRGKPTQFVLPNLPQITFYGRVVDEQKHPIAGAELDSVFMERYRPNTRVAPVAVTDADGNFVISGRGIGITIFDVRRDGYVPLTYLGDFILTPIFRGDNHLTLTPEHRVTFKMRRPNAIDTGGAVIPP